MVDKHRRRGTLLDVGTGIGQFLSFAKQTHEVDGTEVSVRAIEIARMKYGLRIRRGTVEELDFGDRCFEVITLFHVLEHVREPKKLLLRCRELLSDGGILIVAVPNELRSWKVWIKSALTFAGYGHSRGYGPYGLRAIRMDRPGEEIHLSHFTVGTIQSLFRACGLTIIDVDIDPYHAYTGVRQLCHELAYRTCKLIYGAFRVQLGEALWFVAERSPICNALHG
jgi:SAM-dependent methyltransferase